MGNKKKHKIKYIEHKDKVYLDRDGLIKYIEYVIEDSGLKAKHTEQLYRIITTVNNINRKVKFK